MKTKEELNALKEEVERLPFLLYDYSVKSLLPR